MDKIKAYVLSGAGDDDVRTWLRDYCGATIVPFVEANLLVFVGGSDVTPGMYGEQNVHSFTDYGRDKNELALFQFAQAVGMPMLGICRGSQFLHAAMGGSLWQDVTDHCCQHSIRDCETGDIIDDTTSTHHQMVRMKWDNYEDAASAGFVLMAVADERRSKYYRCDEAVFKEGWDNGADIAEVEVYRYDREGTSIMGIQGHPEWGGQEFAGWASCKVVAWHSAIEQEPEVMLYGGVPAGYGVVEDEQDVAAFDRAAYQADVAAQ